MSDWMHLHTFVDRERKRSKNGDDVVVLDVIQITDDQRRTDGTSVFNTRTEQPHLLLLDPAREGGEVEGDGTSSSTTAWC